jgi:hypothetical protein
MRIIKDPNVQIAVKTMVNIPEIIPGIRIEYGADIILLHVDK